MSGTVFKMKTVIRDSVFETNSSSCHSLVFSCKEIEQPKEYDPQTGMIVLEPLSLWDIVGRNNRVLITFGEKLSYLMYAYGVRICNYSISDINANVNSVIKEYNDGGSYKDSIDFDLGFIIETLSKRLGKINGIVIDKTNKSVEKGDKLDFGAGDLVGVSDSMYEIWYEFVWEEEKLLGFLFSDNVGVKMYHD